MKFLELVQSLADESARWSLKNEEPDQLLETWDKAQNFRREAGLSPIPPITHLGQGELEDLLLQVVLVRPSQKG